MMKLAHIINPVNVSIESDLYIAQPITFRSMIKAKKYSSDRSDINQYAIGYEEDLLIFPKEFVQLPTLKRSVLDVGEFKKRRKLPLIHDLLSPLRMNKEIEYVVYTNVDIALMPFFYDYILSKIVEGSDSLVINRRVIEHATDFTQMCAEIGEPHPGFDCFVFRRELLDNFDLGHTCIGANWIGRVLISNLIMFSNRLEIIKDAHLTFHIGEDGAWLMNNFSEFDLHNKNEAYRIIKRFIQITQDEEKKSKLRDILIFMDQWGIKEHPKTTQNKKWSMKRKIKNKLRKYLP